MLGKGDFIDTSEVSLPGKARDFSTLEVATDVSLKESPYKVGWTIVKRGLYNGGMEGSGRLIKLVGIGLAIGVVLIGARLLVVRQKPEPEPKRIQEVTIAREDTSITLTREGTLTVRIPEGIFQQQWDDERVAAFFAKFESEDFSAFAQYGEEVEGYTITYTTYGGEVVRFTVPFIDIPIPEALEELIETLEELKDAFPTPTPTPGKIMPKPTLPPYRPTPTPTPTPFKFPTPTPTPPGGGDGGDYGGWPDYYIPFVCEFINPEIRPDILSETVCTPQ